MAQTTILAAGTTVTTSSTVAVPPGGSVTLGLFVASGNIPNNVSAIVQVTTPGAAVNIGSLSKQTPTFLVPGPCTVQVLRQEAGGASVGVYAESAIGQPVEGNVASGATDSGNPLKIGGVFNTTPPTLTNGQRGDAQADTRANLRTRLVAHVASGFDGVSNTTNGFVSAFDSTQNALDLSVAGRVYNGSTWDRQRGDTVATSVLPGLSGTFWNYSAASGGIVSSTAGVTIKAAAGASVRNYISNGSISWGTLSAITEFVIRDGASGTVIYRTILPTVAGERKIPSYLRSTADTLLEIATLTSVTGGVYFNCQGFTGA